MWLNPRGMAVRGVASNVSSDRHRRRLHEAALHVIRVCPIHRESAREREHYVHLQTQTICNKLNVTYTSYFLDNRGFDTNILFWWKYFKSRPSS